VVLGISVVVNVVVGAWQDEEEIYYQDAQE